MIISRVCRCCDHNAQAWLAGGIGHIGGTQPLTILEARRVQEIPCPTEIARRHLRSLQAPMANGRVQEAHRCSGAWRSDTALTVTLTATTGFVLLILGFAFHWQATRARETDLIYDTVRSRIDTALNRGRCGLWDWDLARGRIFWSHSMFAMLGLETRDDLLAFGEVNALVHPEIHFTKSMPNSADAQ